MGKLIYGKNTVVSSLNEGRVLTLYLKDNFSDANVIALAKKKSVITKYLSMGELEKMSNHQNHQGIIAEVIDFEYSSVDDIIKCAKNSKHPLILILDEIADPHNLGAIIRSADAFSVDGIIMKSRNQVSVNATVYKVSTGAINFVKIAQVSNLSNAIKKLKDNGYWVYASDGGGKEEYQKQDFSGPVALIVGSEGFGISRLVLDNSDIVMKIPMSGHVNSLNVSVATGILLAQVRANEN